MCTKVINRKTYKGNDYIYIGRGTPFGNPNSHLDGFKTREDSINAYQYDFDKKIKTDIIFKIQVLSLHGKILGCSCKPQKCHGDVIKNYLDSIQNIKQAKRQAYNLYLKFYPDKNVKYFLTFLKN